MLIITFKFSARFGVYKRTDSNNKIELKFKKKIQNVHWWLITGSRESSWKED
jgi:hypothetical protein